MRKQLLGLIHTSSTPPIDGPMTRARLNSIEKSATALSKTLVGTSSRIRDCDADGFTLRITDVSRLNTTMCQKTRVPQARREAKRTLRRAERYESRQRSPTRLNRQKTPPPAPPKTSRGPASQTP